MRLKKASAEARQQLLERAGKTLEVPVDRLEVRDRRIRHGFHSSSLQLMLFIVLLEHG